MFNSACTIFYIILTVLILHTVSNFLQLNVHLLFSPAGSSDRMVNRTGESTRIQQELYIREDR